MYYWEASPITNQWAEVYDGVPPVGGVDVAVPGEAVTIKVVYDPEFAIVDASLRNFKRKSESDPARFTFVNVARVYPIVGGVPKEGVEITCPETVISFDWINRTDSKGLRIMPKGVMTPVKVFVSDRRWVQRKFDKI